MVQATVLQPDTLGRVAAMNVAFFPSYLYCDLGGIPSPSLKMAVTLRKPQRQNWGLKTDF